MLDCGVAYNINLLIITHMKLFIKFKIVFMAGQFQRMFVSCGGNGGGIPKICGWTGCLFGKPGVRCVRRWTCVPAGGRLRTVLRRRGFLRGRWDEAGCFRMESSGFVEIGLVQAGLAGGVP